MCAYLYMHVCTQKHTQTIEFLKSLKFYGLKNTLNVCVLDISICDFSTYISISIYEFLIHDCISVSIRNEN